MEIIAERGPAGGFISSPPLAKRTGPSSPPKKAAIGRGSLLRARLPDQAESNGPPAALKGYSEGIIRYAIHSGTPVIVDDVEKDPLFADYSFDSGYTLNLYSAWLYLPRRPNTGVVSRQQPDCLCLL